MPIGYIKQKINGKWLTVAKVQANCLCDLYPDLLHYANQYLEEGRIKIIIRS